MQPSEFEELRLRFRCLRCGECCKGESTVSLTEKEIEAISNFLGMVKEAFLALYTVRKGLHRLEMKVVDGHCVFFEPYTKTCRIHPVKPKICKDWPFVSALLKDSLNIHILKEFCKGFKNLLNLEVE